MEMLFVIDMQNDFIDQDQGKMAIKGADALIEPIKEKILAYRKNGDLVVFTKDSHIEVYDRSNESRASGEQK
jgi:nicotinamidase/pyrazinamidase